jgi:hypothetical protein
MGAWRSHGIGEEGTYGAHQLDEEEITRFLQLKDSPGEAEVKKGCPNTVGKPLMLSTRTLCRMTQTC